jgi:hypothetical protein
LKKITLPFVVIGLVAILVATLAPLGAAAGFDQSRVIDDEAFTNTGAMSGVAIQNFLGARNSVLAGYQENGRSAASIISDASNAHRINPQVILATLQKEQGLLTLTSYDTAADPSSKLRKAAGYACPDSGNCDSKYAGFTNQVDGLAFQLRYNFDGSRTKKFTDYQVGQTMTFDGTALVLNNQATASLYRYTPHVSGNRSFYNTFFTYFLEYSADFAAQNSYPVIAPGDSFKLSLKLQNVGNKSWARDIVKLGTDAPKDRISRFLRENRTGNGEPTQWNSDKRVSLSDGPVVPGGFGSFDFYMTAPADMKSGTYREYFRPIAEGVQWMDDRGIYWDVKVVNHEAQWAGQNFGQKTVEPGQSFMMEVHLRNSGQTTWKNYGDNPVRLATSRSNDRIPAFTREDRQNFNPSGWVAANRIALVETTVAPGEIGTFRFWYTVPGDMKAGTYREYFQPVHQGVGFMNDLGLYFDITVGPQQAKFLSQSGYPTLSRGESAQFTVNFENTGTTTWKKSGDLPMRLGTLRATDHTPGFIRDDTVNRNPSGWISPNRVEMVQNEVAPGQTGTFKFWMTVPGDKPAGTYREYFGLTQDGYGYLQDNGLYWDITVR